MTFTEEWKNIIHDNKFILSLIIVIIILISTLITFSKFLLYIENRQGFSYNDPLLKFFDAIDLNWFIFSLIYLSLISGLVFLIKSPKDLITALTAFTIMVWIRTLFMYSLPLNPPVGTIDLKDPLIFIIGTGQKITKDLFFSGHTSTLFLIFLSVKKKNLKIIYLTATILVGLFVMLQKAHYSIDVFTAPFVAFCAYKISESIFKKLF
jgi:hypothetical protein